MKIVKIDNPSEVKRIADSVFGHKCTYSNYYGIDLDNTICLKEDDNVVFQKFFDGYSRIYVSGDDTEVMSEILSTLDGICILNIPTKGTIDNWDRLISYSRFKPLAIYSRYVNSTFSKWASDKDINFAKPSDVELIETQINQIFSKYLAHLPNYTQLCEYVSENNILIERDTDGKVSGAVCIRCSGKTADLPFFYSNGHNSNGLNILFNAFHKLYEIQVKRIVFWVNDGNVSTIKLHSLLGAKPDGMKDYIFIKE